MPKIALDAGHGLHTAGKQTPDGIKEWTLNDKVRDKVVAILKDYDVIILNTDNDEGEVDEALGTRLATYKNAGVDVFVSIHHNAYTGSWGNATGVEVYTDRNYTAQDQNLAELIYNKMVQYTGMKGRGVKRANFAVINQNTIPAVLCEGGFMDGVEDYKIITSDAGQSAYAKAVAEGLIEFLGLKKLSVNQNGLQATSLVGMSEKDVVAKVGPLFTADQRKTGILASVSMAQFILESSYGKSELAQNANNCFGMKTSLSGNTWSGSTWDGTKYAKVTKEYVNGGYISVTADFRSYKSIEESISDHSAYLLGAMNGSKKRYGGLAGMTDYKAALQLIKDGGYATSPTYVSNLCSVVEKWNLTQYDVKAPAPAPAPAKKSNEEIAKEVLAGKWGNGADRKTNLTKAGYDYSAIQTLVNAMVSGKTVSSKKSNEEIAKEVLAGKWGNGAERKAKITKAGYNYSEVQKMVNKMLTK